MTADPIERAAKAMHRVWCRQTYRHHVRGGEETEDEAHDRRWRELPERTRQEFLDMAEAAAHIFNQNR